MTIYQRNSILASIVTLLAALLISCDDSKTSETQETPEKEQQSPAPENPESNTVKTRVASCNCGQLRVTCTGPDPERISLCHCKLCQKQSGSAFAIQARFPKEQVKIEGKSTAWKFPIPGAEPVDFRNCVSEGGEFHFCPTCGSTVYYTADTDDARIGVKIGAFADPTFPAPKISGFEEYRQPWAMEVGKLKMEHVK